MNSSAENTASNAADESSNRAVHFDLSTARRLLPLVRRIVADIVHNRERLVNLAIELDDLDRRRRSLAWPARSRRYRLREEIVDVETTVRDAHAELEQLGVLLFDETTGRLGFMTTVNGQRAFFSWQPNEDGLTYWHFAGETQRRTIPATWQHATELRLISTW